MAWFKCGGGGIPAALKNAMNTVFNKKFGTSTTYQPDGWPDNVNLMGPLEEKTVSGSIVAFSDGADDVPLKKCEITIPANLTGVSSVDVVQTGRNLLEIDSSYDIPTRATTLTRDYSNNVLHIYGEIQDTNSNYYSQDITDLVREMGTITIIANTVSGGSADLSFRVNVQNGSTVVSRLAIGDTSRTITYTDGYTYLLMFFVSISATVGNTVNMTVNFEADYGSSVGTYTPYVTPTTYTANLGRTIYGGEVDVVNGTGTDENGNDFTFTAVPVNSLLDDNTLWSDSGDLEVVYRSTGTETIITPTLVTKAITENGTYTAAADNADGYSSVTVEVPAGPSNIETVLGSGVLIEVAGVSGTDVSRTMWTRTAAQDEKVIFHPNTQVKTNTGANDGYFKVLKNDVVVVSTYANTSTTTALVIPDIDLEAGDVLTISVGFDNYHTSAWFDIWSTITILSSGSAPVLGLSLGNPGPVNEPEEEEPDAAPEEQDEIQEETPEEVDQNESDE